MVLLPSGCSIHYIGDDGSETYFGLLWLRHYPAGEPVVVHTKRMGLAVDAGTQGHGVLVGYEHLLRVLPPSNRSIKIDYSSEGSISFTSLTADDMVTYTQAPPKKKGYSAQPSPTRQSGYGDGAGH